MTEQVTQERLRELFDYQDGHLIWRVPVRNQVRIGDHAGGLNGGRSGKRMRTMVDGRKYLVHRLIYLWHNGSLPKILDHKNGDTLDNRIENLRAATASQNMRNAAKHSPWAMGPTSHFKGVKWRPDREKWRVDIKVNGKSRYLGLYADPQDAARAYDGAAREIHGAFARLNFPDGEAYG